jgi:hypothetical protein
VIFITGNSFSVSPFFSLQNSEEVCDKTEILAVGAAQAGDYEVSTSMRGQRVKEIAEAMVGNTVWCCNSWFAPLTTPCAEVAISHAPRTLNVACFK